MLHSSISCLNQIINFGLYQVMQFYTIIAWSNMWDIFWSDWFLVILTIWRDLNPY